MNLMVNMTFIINKNNFYKWEIFNALVVVNKTNQSINPVLAITHGYSWVTPLKSIVLLQDSCKKMYEVLLTESVKQKIQYSWSLSSCQSAIMLTL